MIISIIICVIPFLVGILTSAFGIKIVADAILKLITYKKIRGTVVSFYRKLKPEKGEKLYPVFEYIVLGEIFMQKSKKGYYSKECRYKVGQEIEIYYNLQNAGEYHEKGHLIGTIIGGIAILGIGSAIVYFSVGDTYGLFDVINITLQ